MTDKAQTQKEVLDALPYYPTEEEAEVALRACGTSGKEVVNEFIERLLRENLRLREELSNTRARVNGGVATVDMYAPSSKREALRLLDAIEQSIRGLSQPSGPMETATRIKLSAEYGLAYVAALRERLSTDYAVPAPIAAPVEGDTP